MNLIHPTITLESLTERAYGFLALHSSNASLLYVFGNSFPLMRISSILASFNSLLFTMMYPFISCNKPTIKPKQTIIKTYWNSIYKFPRCFIAFYMKCSSRRLQCAVCNFSFGVLCFTNAPYKIHIIHPISMGVAGGLFLISKLSFSVKGFLAQTFFQVK